MVTAKISGNSTPLEPPRSRMPKGSFDPYARGSLGSSLRASKEDTSPHPRLSRGSYVGYAASDAFVSGTTPTRPRGIDAVRGPAPRTP